MKGLPQIIFLMVMAMNLATCVIKHGKPRENWSFWDFLVGGSFTIGLLFWGGYFDVLLVVFK